LTPMLAICIFYW